MKYTTHGQAKVENGEVVIHFGILSDGPLEEVTLNVDAYAEVLIRDLAGAVVDRNDIRGVA